MIMREYYSRLFLKDGASIEEVKKAHRKLVKKFHPDKNQENEFTEEFKLIQEAYEILIKNLNNNSQSEYTSTSAYSPNNNNFSNQTEKGVVKSEAKFAEASDAQFAEQGKDDAFYKAFLGVLICLFVLCGIYATLAQKNLLIKIGLLAFIATSLITIGYSAFKKNSKKAI